MSRDTWLQEFMPTEAADCPVDQALAHSRLKWSGLTEEALSRHEMRIGVRCITEKHEPFLSVPISSDSCALCHHHYDKELGSEGQLACQACPLFKVGSVSCDGHRQDGRHQADHPWGAWAHRENPVPMIALLDAAQ